MYDGTRSKPWYYSLLIPLSIFLTILGIGFLLAAISTMFFMHRHDSGLPAILLIVCGIVSAYCFGGSWNCVRYKRHLDTIGYW